MKSKSIEFQFLNRNHNNRPTHTMSAKSSSSNLLSSVNDEVLRFLSSHGPHLTKAWKEEVERLKSAGIWKPVTTGVKRKYVKSSGKAKVKKSRTAYTFFIGDYRPKAVEEVESRVSRLAGEPCKCKRKDPCSCTQEQKDASSSPQNILRVAAGAWKLAKQDPLRLKKYTEMAARDKERWEKESQATLAVPAVADPAPISVPVIVGREAPSASSDDKDDKGNMDDNSSDDMDDKGNMDHKGDKGNKVLDLLNGHGEALLVEIIDNLKDPSTTGTRYYQKELELKFKLKRNDLKAHRGWIEKVVENILAIDSDSDSDSDSDDSGSDEE